MSGNPFKRPLPEKIRRLGRELDPDDMGDTFRLLDAIKQEKRAGNRESSAKVLTDKKVAFSSNNGGAHLIVTHKEVVVDFWPGTGLWLVRKLKTKGRGVFKLLRYLGVE